jgi:hypothetical protein
MKQKSRFKKSSTAPGHQAGTRRRRKAGVLAEFDADSADFQKLKKSGFQNRRFI